MKTLLRNLFLLPIFVNFSLGIALASPEECSDLFSKGPLRQFNNKNSETRRAWLDPNSLQKEVIGNEESVNPRFKTSSNVEVKMTMNKRAVEGQKFLYEMSYQYGSKDFDGEQSIPAVSFPTYFRIRKDRLELVLDRSMTTVRLKEFISNTEAKAHPAVFDGVILSFSILENSADTITIADTNSTDVLMGTTASATSKLAKSWIRNDVFDQDRDLLMTESSVRTDNGSVIEVLESLIPSNDFAPSAEFEVIALDPRTVTGNGSDRPTVVQGRYNFMADVIKERTSIGIRWFASHFDIAKTEQNPQGTIDFYATPEFPEAYMRSAKAAIEGYNRYFLKMSGIQRPVVRFMGRVPPDAIIGDTRYNTIGMVSNGGGYGDQTNISIDPGTGRIIHAGINFVNDDFDLSLQTARGFVYQNLSLEPEQKEAYQLEVALQNIMFSSILHETGHALGMSHNRHSSTMIDLKNGMNQASSLLSALDELPFTFSINSFTSAYSSEGPILEWDDLKRYIFSDNLKKS